MQSPRYSVSLVAKEVALSDLTLSGLRLHHMCFSTSSWQRAKKFCEREAKSSKRMFWLYDRAQSAGLLVAGFGMTLSEAELALRGGKQNAGQNPEHSL